MKRILLAFAALLFVTSAVAAPIRNPELETYARRSMMQCPDADLTIEPITESGPTGFDSYRVTLTSRTNEHCREVAFAIVSKKTNQIILASVYVLPADERPVEQKIAEVGAKLLDKTPKVLVGKMPLADGLRPVTISFATPVHPLELHAYLDASSRFLLVGTLGDKTKDPRRQLLSNLDIASAAQRGAQAGAIEILEISDFQCPSCKNAHDQMEALLSKYGDRISYRRLDLPFFEHHDWALRAALAARALQKVAPQVYWPYVDYIFKNQGTLSAGTIDTAIRNFVEDHDVAWSKVAPLYNSAEEKKKIVQQVGRMYDNNVYATPTFIVNGERMFYDGNIEVMSKHIQSLLAAKK